MPIEVTESGIVRDFRDVQLLNADIGISVRPDESITVLREEHETN